MGHDDDDESVVNVASIDPRLASASDLFSVDDVVGAIRVMRRRRPSFQEAIITLVSTHDRLPG